MNGPETKMNLFAYGTLMWPEVLAAVMGRRMESAPAVLKDHKRLRVKGQCYPAVVPSQGDSVEGALYRGLTAEEFRRLDLFEGAEYDRIKHDFDGAPAFVYVLSAEHARLAAAEPWDPAMMTPEALAAFCSEYKGWSGL